MGESSMISFLVSLLIRFKFFSGMQYSLLSLSYWFNIDFLTKEAMSKSQNLPDWSKDDRIGAKVWKFLKTLCFKEKKHLFLQLIHFVKFHDQLNGKSMTGLNRSWLNVLSLLEVCFDLISSSSLEIRITSQ